MTSNAALINLCAVQRASVTQPLPECMLLLEKVNCAVPATRQRVY